MLFALAWISLPVLYSEVVNVGASEPYRNDFGVACRAGQVGSCVANKCVNIGRYTHICTQCQGDKVPINGVCSDGSGGDSNPDNSMCNKVTKDGSSYCTGCNARSSGSGTYFLFYGGCYDTAVSPGSLVCSSAASGVCTACNTNNRYVFVNEDNQAPEKCILCSDDIGFSGNQGVSDCATCNQGSWKYAPFHSSGIQCTTCFLKEKAPIDGSCQDFGLHVCSDGYCKYCYKTHLYHNGGCYDRSQQYSASICSPSNQFVLGDYAGCKECANSNEVPREGNCRRELDVDNCSKDPARGMCLNCQKSSPGTITFLYMGGCYHTNGTMGSQVCQSAAGGVCTKCAIYGCTQCDLQATVIRCNDCGSSYLSLDSSACFQSCPSPSQRTASGTPNRCECNSGYSLNTATMTCDSISNCPVSVIGCSQCDENGLCTACVYSAYNIQPDRQSCSLGCPENFTGVAGELCRCIDGYVLKDNTCIAPPSNKSGLSSGTVVAIVIVVLILLVVAGVLCWFFLKKKKRTRSMSAQSIEAFGLLDVVDAI